MLSKQRLMQADATPWHEMLTLSSNENTNPFLKQTKALPWTWKNKRELCCFCVLNAVEKQGQCVRWSVRSTYSFTPFGRGFPQELLQFDLFGLGWRKGRPLTRTAASTFNTTVEEERTNHKAAAATFHFYRLSLRQSPITDRGTGCGTLLCWPYWHWK